MFKIISQTNDFIVVNKSAGVSFHDEGDIGSGLFSQVKAQLKIHLNSSANNQSTTTDTIDDLYPVHRLDKMTSGLVVFATHLASAQAFSQLFESHQVEKYYLAISEQKPIKKQGLIKGDMGKSRRGMFKLMRTMHNPAITQFFSYTLEQGKRLYLLKPHSGKTHQLRVALASISAPILGDPLYGSKTKNSALNFVDRGYLHAYALRFEFMNKHYEFTLPADQGAHFITDNVQHKLDEIGQPWLVNWPNIKKVLSQ